MTTGIAKKRQRRTQALDNMGAPPAGMVLTGDPDAESGMAWSAGTVVMFNAGAFVPPSTEYPFPDRYMAKLVSGAAAGDVTLTGVRTVDELESVINLTDGDDLTAEFSISAADTINNTGGTSTATKSLLVRWHRRGYDLTGLAYDAASIEKAAISLLAPSSWPSVTVAAYLIAADSGVARFYLDLGGSPQAAVDVTLAAFVGKRAVLASNVSTGWQTPAGATSQMTIAALYHEGDHVNDTLAERPVVLGIELTPGT